MRKKVLSEKAVLKNLEDLASHPAYATYVSDGKTYKVDTVETVINEKEHRLYVQFVMNDEITDDASITHVTVYDENSDVWADSEENILRESYVEGIFYRFDFKVGEGKLMEED